MEINRSKAIQLSLIIGLIFCLTFISGRLRADTGSCGGASTTIPFTDVPGSNIFFCSIAEAFFSGLTNGSTATTYSPSADVPREQMAAFVTRTLDQSLKRGSLRAALDQFWTTQGPHNVRMTTVGFDPALVKSDGADLWVANSGSNTVSRVQGSDGRLLETWTGAVQAWGVLCAMGKVFVTSDTVPGNLYLIDPSQPPGAVTVLANNLGDLAHGIAFDGQRIWTANQSGSVSIITLNPVTVTNVSTGFTSLQGFVYDGANIWVTDNVAATGNKLHKLATNGAILQSVDVGAVPANPAFDGTNIWVPNRDSNTVSVVRALGGLSGTVIATLNANGLSGPQQVAFDGERILVTNIFGHSVSLWRATDLTPLGSFLTGSETAPFGACSDGLNFWITLNDASRLVRF